MPNKVFANNNEVCCKAGAGKTIAALPDTCFTPPENPATPPGVPLPYPNTGKSSDLTKGTKSVKISNKEVGKKNESHFKTSYGDEAGCAAKKGVVTSKNKGKVYFNAWSSDVKFEGANAVRHLDITTNNHMGSAPGDTPPWPFIDSSWPSSHPCKGDVEKQEQACKGVDDPCPPKKSKSELEAMGKSGRQQHFYKTAAESQANECLAASRCILSPYKPSNCCDSQTPHHMVEAGAFFEGERGKTAQIVGSGQYSVDAAPCICVEGYGSGEGSHGLMHAWQASSAVQTARPGNLRLTNGGQFTPANGITDYGTLRDSAAEAVTNVFPSSGCNEECLKAQMNQYHRKHGIRDRTPVKSIQTGLRSGGDVKDAVKTFVDMYF